VLLTVRQHWFTILLPLLVYAFLAVVPMALWAYFAPAIAAKGLVTEYFFVVSVWYLLLWMATFYSLTMYILNVIIITDERIIDNHQLGFFDRKVSELHIHKVQDVSVHTRGIIETLLHFGDLMVQTAAEEREFIFKDLPHPDEIKDIIMRAVASRDRKRMQGIDTEV
jgi:hypothetical protein